MLVYGVRRLISATEVDSVFLVGEQENDESTPETPSEMMLEHGEKALFINEM